MKNILIVEDDPAVRGMMEKLLKKRDREFHSAGTGLEAIGAMRAQRPDLIILDFFLPDMVALNLMTHVKELCPHVPVIIVSSFWNMGYAKLAAEENELDFISKPIDPQELMEIVDLRLAE